MPWPDIRRWWRPTSVATRQPWPRRPDEMSTWSDAEAGAAWLGAGTPLLSLEEVTTYYAQMRILERISLQVGSGELVCLLGGNASGKSTTLKTILGLVH